MDVATKPIVTIVVLTFVLMVSSYFHHILSEVFITKASYDFLQDIDYKLEHIPLRKTEKYNPAYLNNRIFNDILTTLGFIIHNYLVAIIMIVSTIVLFILIIQINVYLVLIPIAALTINILGILFLNKAFYKRGYQYRELNNQYLSDNNDLISQIKETKIHSWQDISGQRVEKSFKELLKTGISLNKVLAALNNIGTFSKNLTLVLTMLVGGTLIINQTITIGEFVLITYYTNMCLNYSEYFLKLGQEYQHAKISNDRLEELLEIENENNGTKLLEKITKIKINNLEFSYPESSILFKDFNHTFNKGKIYCLRGKNGEGKTTFIDLLLGLDYNFKGSIEYNDIKLSDLDMIAIRKKEISVVMQEPRLQRMTVLENITRGIVDYSVESLNKLCDLFGLKNIIDLEESISLSGGEKQKVSIIRGILKNPSLIIMDEPISALDTSSINVLKQELSKRKNEAIIILISHNEELFDIIDEFIELPTDNV
jgi:ATP-binding cassette subfamily C protein